MNIVQFLKKSLAMIFGITGLIGIFVFLPQSVAGYSIGRNPKHLGNHELSVWEPCNSSADCILEAMVEGVREPDMLHVIPWQMGWQRVFALDGHIRPISQERARIQHIHGNPLPLLVDAGNLPHTSMNTHQNWPKTLAASKGENARPDLLALVNMRQYRNKMLAQTASWLCVGLPHVRPEQAWRKMGNIAHMVGDTYSASHTLRDSQDPRYLWMTFSMDTVMWKQHIVGDANNQDFRFETLQKELTVLIQLFAQGRQYLQNQESGHSQSYMQHLNQVTEPIFDHLCEQVWKMDGETLAQPAGGSTKEWSASMNQGMAMMPSGLADDQELQMYLQNLQKQYPDFFYPHPNTADFCENRSALRCDWSLEVLPALENASQVQNLFVPQVQRD